MNQPKTILEAIRLHANETPDKLCVGDKNGSYTYGQFWKLLCNAAVFLKEKGIGNGDIVVIRGAQKVEFMVAMFASQLAGAAAAPLEKAVKDDRINEIIEILGSRFYIAERAVKNEAVINIPMKELLSVEEKGEEPALPEPDALAEILFTTGTTGISKGIEITAGSDAVLSQNVNEAMEMTPDEVELITTPLNHALGLRRYYGNMYIGSAAIFTEGVKFVNDFFALLEQYHVTSICFVPAILEQLLLAAKDRFGEYGKQLHYIELGSAATSESNKALLIEMFPDVRLYNGYGSSESSTSIVLEFSKYKDKENCIGRNTINTRVLFVDENRNEVQASKENPGFLAFIGGQNMRGYFKDPETTAGVLDENGVVYTNDIGYQGEDGLYYLLGRRGEVINMGGIKVAPGEVEDAANQHPMVKECACIPVKDPITGEGIKLFVVLNDGFAFDQKALAKHLMNKLEALKVPKEYEVIDALPRTYNGKILRRVLQEREAQKLS